MYSMGKPAICFEAARISGIEKTRLRSCLNQQLEWLSFNDEFATLKPNDQVEPDSTHISETKGRESNRSETQGDD